MITSGTEGMHNCTFILFLNTASRSWTVYGDPSLLYTFKDLGVKPVTIGYFTPIENKPLPSRREDTKSEAGFLQRGGLQELTSDVGSTRWEGGCVLLLV
jgi:hypothetical protein